jgi:class 3 adenylate cyclase
MSSAERRQLTVMFCDLVGSTALSTQLDPEDLREVVGAYHRRAAEVVAAFGGFLAKYMGDGILVYFGYPQAQEDDPERAVSAGLQLVLAVRATRPRPNPELSVRVGIATGLAVVGDLIGSGAAEEQAVVGETPNLAARLQSLAEPNSVVVAQSTRQLVGDLFEYRELGAVDLKGFATPVRAFEVVRARAVESRFEALHAAQLTPVVGREEQIELLERRWQQAREGEGRVVLITGEAGIGKSRIVAAIQDRLCGETPTRLSYQCTAHLQNSPLHPLIAQLERAAGFDRDDTELSKVAKLEEFLAGTSTPAEDVALLTELLSLSGASSHQPVNASPQRRKQMTFEALVRRLERLAFTRPVLMMSRGCPLDRSHVEGTARRHGRSAAVPSCAADRHLPARYRAAVGWPGTCHAAPAQPYRSAAGGRTHRARCWRQGAADGGIGAGHFSGTGGAPICGGVDQGAPG